MRIFVLAFFAGNLSIHFSNRLIAAGVLGLLICIALFQQWRTGWHGALGFLLGAGGAAGYLALHLPLAQQYPEMPNKVIVEGHIASVVRHQPKMAQFDFAVHRVCYHKQCYARHFNARFSWYGPVPGLWPGDEWRLAVKLKAPRGLANPGSGAFDVILLQQAIATLGYVRAGPQNQLLAPASWHFVWAQLRQQLAIGMEQWLPHSPYRGLLSALTTGLRGEVSQTQWSWLQRTGTSHLMAISGLHVGLVAGMAFFLVNRGWRWWPFLMLHLAAPRAAALAAMIAAFGYSALAGFSIPTLRSWVMVMCLMSALWLKRSIRPMQSLLLALWIVLLIQPLAPLNAGFWLSFVAVATLLYGVVGRCQTSGLRGWRWARLQLSLFLGLAPLSLFFFQQLSFVSFFANAFAIPWVSFVIVPGGLLGCLSYWIAPTLAGFFWSLSAHALALLMHYLEWWSHLSLAVWQSGSLSFWQLLMASAGVMGILAPRGWPARWLGGIGLLPLLLLFKPAVAPGAVELTVLDVGQGLAVVVRTATHLLIYDTGPSYGPGADAGSRVIVPFLRTLGAKHVDTLVVSHGDNDHRGGAVSLMAAVPVKQLLTSVPERFPNSTAAAPCHYPQQWTWDEVHFQMLYPQQLVHQSSNNYSCVLKITAGEHTVLLPGDIEREAERALLRAVKTDLAASIVIAPHHGSRTSSSRAFVQAVQPQYVVFPVGFDNRYRFPNVTVVERYHAQGAKIYTTAEAGAIRFELRPGVPIAKPYLYRLQQ